VANDHASLPIAHRLYLPQAWADDPARRSRAGVPDSVRSRPALNAGVPPAPVLADAGYGVHTDFRDGITALGMRYISDHLSNWIMRSRTRGGFWPTEPKGCGDGQNARNARKVRMRPSETWGVPWQPGS
jgi:DDE superfamily endonuclease